MTSKLDHLQDANFPRDPEGRVYHLGVKRGEGIEKKRKEVKRESKNVIFTYHIFFFETAITYK